MIATMIGFILIPNCDKCYYSVPIYLFLCIAMVSYMTSVYPIFP